MRQILITTLLLCVGLASCTDHNATLMTDGGPAAPINKPDNKVVQPDNGSGASNNPGNNGGNAPGGGGGSNAGNGGSSGNGGNQGNGSTGGSQPGGGGGSGASPVPEPSTLFLVGSGLAGLAGLAMRRRKRQNANA